MEVLWQLIAMFNAVGWIATALVGWRFAEHQRRRITELVTELGRRDGDENSDK